MGYSVITCESEKAKMINKVFDLLSNEDKKSAIFIILLITLQALLEVAGAASIIPLLIIFVGSGNALNNSIIERLADFSYNMGIPQDANFTLIFILALLVLTILTLIVRSYSSYRKNLFVEKTRFSLSKRLLQSYLSQDYEYFLTQNANDLSKNLLSEVDQVIGKAVYSLVNMAVHLVVGSAILLFLFFVNPVIALFTLLVAGCLYGVIYLSVSKSLFRMGQERLRRNKERFVFAGEIFGGIKSIKVLRKEAYSVQKFLDPSLSFSLINAKRQFINEVPSFLVEAVAICALILFTYFNIISESVSSPSDFIPIMGVYAYSFYKLKPAINSIFVGLSSLKYCTKTIEKLSADLSMLLPNNQNSDNEDKLSLKDRIKLVDVSYHYGDTTDQALSSISFEIKSGNSVAIVGSTGSGKTTLVNIILGLLEQTEGKILLDDSPLNKTNTGNWQKSIGYVSQDIFMMDTSLAENIAFGIPKDLIDMDAVKKAAHVAKIGEFIETKLEDGYNTTIGDRGIRLSGGEKQRIGIARALYTDPNILIFDEATSALDSVTEKEIIEEIYKLSPQKTIIMIAHRLSTVEQCDSIIVLNNGRIETMGTYDDLIKRKNSFSTMLNI